MVLIGEIGGSMENEAARIYKKSQISKTWLVFIAGRTPLQAEKQSNAGATISGGK